MSGEHIAPMHRQRVRLEELEERIAPAGGVTAAMHDGSLIITGDNLGNHVYLDQDGLAPGQMRVSGGPGDITLINGHDAPVIFSGVTDGVIANLRGGDDTLVLSDDVTVGGGLSVNLGAGDDFLVVRTGVTVGGSLQMSLGSGHNRVICEGANVVHGDLLIRGGTSYDEVLTFSGDDDLGIVVHGTTTFTDPGGRSGFCLVGMFYGDVTIKEAGSASFAGQPNAQYVSLEGGFYQSVSIAISTGSTSIDVTMAAVGGNLTIRNGAGTHDYNIRGLMVAGDATIADGAGESSLRLGFCGEDAQSPILPLDIQGDFRYSAGAGYHEVDIMYGAVHGSCIINLGGAGRYAIQQVAIGDGDSGGGDLCITDRSRHHPGEDGDRLFMASANVAGSVTLDLGDREAYCTIADATIGGALSMHTGAGDDVLYIQLSSIGGGTDVMTGKGADYVGIDDNAFTGALSVNAGSGDDVIQMESGDWGIDSNLNGPSIFHGPATFMGGAGDDIISIGIGYGGGVGVYGYDEFLSPVSIIGGVGSDELRMIGVQNVFHAACSLQGVETIA